MQKDSSQINTAGKRKLITILKDTLKSEFVGIDEPIDRVCDAISLWFLYPELQERPVVVNLWGLTGTGKTSLIRRVVELLEIKQFLRFDMGEAAEFSWSIRNTLEQMQNTACAEEKHNIVIALDEFHHASGKKNILDQSPSPSLRIIWELLDSGKIQLQRYFQYDFHTVGEYLENLKRTRIEGVQGIKGRVSEKEEEFNRIMKPYFSYMSKEEGQELVSSKVKDTLYSEVKYDFDGFHSFEKYLMSMDLKQTIDFIQSVMEKVAKPHQIDLSGSIIFVMGNMDNVYTMSGNYNPDISADDFYLESKKINITHIKSALKDKFRDEQIARLGNNHIIYPAFNKDSYEKLIKIELGKISERFKQAIGINLLFSSEVNDLIYREGVYPAQGTRPVYTTIHQVLSSNLVNLVHYRENNHKRLKTIKIDFIEDYLVAFSDESKSFSWKCKPSLNLEVLRRSKQDNLRTLVSVHESGHAILTAIMHSKLPTYVCSDSLDGQMDGYVYTTKDEDFLSFKWAQNQITVLYGGIVAEELIFGDDKSFGSASDLQKASNLALSAVQQYGLGNYVGVLRTDNEDKGFTYYREKTEKEALKILNKCHQQAVDILTREKELLLRMAELLQEKRTINQEEMTELFTRYAVGRESFVKNSMSANSGQYKSILKKEIDKLNSLNKNLNSKEMMHQQQAG
ncbi:MAG: AAA family ATPase [Bacteroidia bacterium]